MAIDFPASPTPGQVFQGYYWDNVKKAWRSETPSTGAVVTSTTTPTGAKNGDLWYNTNDGTLYVYFDNGITAYWTEVKANSSLNTTLGNRLTAVESGKANLTGGNTFSGIQLKTSQPSFKAYTSGGQINNPTNPTLLVFNDTSYGGGHNVGNYYNTSTGRFTAPVTGRYLFGFSMLTNPGNSTNDPGFAAIYININGTDVHYMAHNHNQTWVMEGSAIVLQLNQNDYVCMNMTYGSGHYGAYSYFSGSLLS